MAQYVFLNAAGDSIPISESYQTAAVVTFTTNVVTNRVVFSTPVPNQTGNNTAEFEAAGPNQCLRIKHAGNDYSFFIGGSAPQTIGVACFKILGGLGGTTPGYRIVAVIAQDKTTAAALIHGMGWNFNNHVVDFISESDAEGDGLVALEREWDEEPTDDPSDPNNENPSGGGYAETDEFGLTDDLPLADMPDGSDLEVDTGSFLTLYVLDADEMATLGTKLFNTTFWTALANKFSGLSDPMKFIISANVMPFLTYDASKEMKLGGVTVETGHSIKYNATRFVQYSFGAVTLKETWGTDKDYSATSVDIYLPYSGVHTLDVDAVMQSTLTLKCNVDLWTGDLVYLLHSSNADMDKKYYKQENVLYRWTGNCATSLPLGTVDPSGPIIKGFSSLAGMAAGFAIAGPAGAAVGGAMASGAGGAAGDGGGAQPQQAGAKQMAGAAVAGLGAATTVLNMDFTPLGGAGNGVSGASGMMDYQFPYLIIKRGVPAYPNNWRAQIGAPRYQTFTLSDLSGYTLFADIKLHDMGTAVQEEIAELERLLTTEGVIL